MNNNLRDCILLKLASYIKNNTNINKQIFILIQMVFCSSVIFNEVYFNSCGYYYYLLRPELPVARCRVGWYWQCLRQVGSGKESPTPMLLIHSMIELLFKNFFYSFQYILNIILLVCGKNGLITCQKVRQGLVGRF